MHLERHARRAAGKYDFECDTCLKRFITAADLKQHKRLHTADRHVCSKCGKSYSNKYSLRQHEVDHSDDKQRPHICQTCGMYSGVSRGAGSHPTRWGDPEGGGQMLLK